ncbi:hypothetical protein ACIBEA_39170 [Streptomyces sp. NPDC051555]|uniref:hypothetical protein n=1 Tax=Streptomyces sp. NPDC051555 TaxID=3365657 RepID=UPI0037BBE094
MANTVTLALLEQLIDCGSQDPVLYVDPETYSLDIDAAANAGSYVVQSRADVLEALLLADDFDRRVTTDAFTDEDRSSLAHFLKENAGVWPQEIAAFIDEAKSVNAE